MASHTLRQYDEMPSWTVKLGWDTDPAQWPALPADAVVTMIAKLRSGSTQILARAVVADAATRTVRWDPVNTQTTVAGTYDVVWRVTYNNGKSQTHPVVGSDLLTIEKAVASTDVTDPAS